ncbi:MAG: hypothetical protein ACTHUU_07650 [Brachybacterium sp.]
MQRPLAVLLVLIGVIGLVLGRLGETTWAPETETTAAVDLADPGSAVVIDPGVLYVGADEGDVVIEGASDVSVITAANGDIDAYLEDVRHTRITGASDWTTLSTQEVNPDGAEELASPTSSDLWRSVETQPSPYRFDVSEFRAGEHGDNAQPYRAILIVTDGTEPGADSVSITWPVDAENEWVPFAYAGGAAIAVIGLVLLVVSIGGRRHDELEDEDSLETDAQHEPAPQPAGAFAVTDTDTDTDTELETGAEPVGATAADVQEPAPAQDDLDGLSTPAGPPEREENVWAFGEQTASEADAEEPALDEGTAHEAGAEQESAPEDEPDEDAGGPVRLFGNDEERR